MPEQPPSSSSGAELVPPRQTLELFVETVLPFLQGT